IKKIREKIKEPVKTETKISDKKKITSDSELSMPDEGENTGKKNTLTAKEILTDVNLEAKLIRLRKMVEQRDFKKAESNISGLFESGVTNPNLYSIAGGIKFIQGKFPEAEDYWKNSVNKGGSIVLRFYHKHGFFNKGCSGQIILKKGLIIFNSVTKPLHSFAVTSDTIKLVKKRKGNFGIEISFYVKEKIKKHVFTLRRKSRKRESFVSDFINKYILGD
ncbi:MAG: hypothetical protein KAR14_11290, partial [Candidatus Aminicenantes bacterium]|nr:hypothetical protein [Candidatus Aminicenantes bacterium]